MIYVLIAFAVVILIYLFLIFPGHAKKEKKAVFRGKNIAHRGLYSQDQSVPENSVKAFSEAADSGYGIELDVQLSRDGQVVVFHDDDLKRACGKDERVDGLDFEELSELSLFGTEQRIPLFTSVLETVRGRTPLIVELKTGKRNRELCEKTAAILSGYDGQYCIESFDPFIVSWFAKNKKDVMRGQLVQRPRDFRKTGQSGAVSFILGNVLMNFLARPHFIAHREGKMTLSARLSVLFGALRVTWTAHDRSCEEYSDTVIFEHFLPDTVFKTK